ncbi:LrgB family protein [Halobacillus salinarum]|uniref:LrgB family protein n=1 Tax=Halobacillus salinarum TaxID=2932257 RepID=A0ABY4ELP8_9BACI|nr:LrgB family protein [Halobacillus salinarum]UOQ44937.1 LrgB family protein [Halobacillus salinarum]
MSLWFALGSIILTVGVYQLSKWGYRRVGHILLSPIFITPLFLIVLLLTADIPYAAYNEGGQWLSYLLGPATVAFAVPIYKHLPLLKKHRTVILVSLSIGSLAGLLTSMLYAAAFQLSGEVIRSLAPRSITTPVAMEVAESLGGIPTLTAVFVIITGITGSLTGPFIIRLLKIDHPLARGLMLGMSAHGIGTSRAFEIGEVEGTFSSLAMILGALITVVFALILKPFLF